VSTPSGVKEECRLPEGRVSFRLPNFTIRERADPKGTEGGGGRRIRPAQSRTQVRTRLREAARRSARKSARGHASLRAGPYAASATLRELPRRTEGPGARPDIAISLCTSHGGGDNDPSAHPRKLQPEVGEGSAAQDADAIAPARAPAYVGRRPSRPPLKLHPLWGRPPSPVHASQAPSARAPSRRGTTTQPSTLSRSNLRGRTSFPRPRWTQSPPREHRPPGDDDPTAHPLEIHRPRDDQLPPSRADAIAPARAPAAVGRRPNRPPSRDPSFAG